MANIRKDVLLKEDLIKNWIKECRPKAYICKELNCKPDTLNRVLKIFGLIYTGNRGYKGYSKPKKTRTVEYYLNSNSFISSHHLKNKILKEGIKEYKCECCKNTLWNNKPIPLELHHINGVENDNRLENLQLLCPNCHAQTEHYRGRAKKSIKLQKESKK